MALFELHKFILQMRMRSHLVGLDVWFLCECAGSPEPSLVAYAISTIISWAGSNRSFHGIFQEKVCSKLFSHLSYFILGYQMGINMNYGFNSSETQNCASFRTCKCTRECVCLRERESVQIIEYGVRSCSIQTKRIFSCFGQRPLYESAASESGSTYISKTELHTFVSGFNSSLIWFMFYEIRLWNDKVMTLHYLWPLLFWPSVD